MTTQSFHNGRVILHAGDCLDVLDGMETNSVDAIVSDPPYFLTSIVKRFGAENAAPAQFGKDGSFSRLSGGFMGRKWDAPEPPAIDPAFAHWFAGFVDGEGCFSVHKKTVNGCETYDCQFSLTVRSDDHDILVTAQRALGGIGTISKRPAPKSESGNAKPQSRFCVSSKSDCQRLAAIFSVFPLRAKKARDFQIWCDALESWVDHEPGGGWDDMRYFREALMAVRNFGSVHRPERLFFYRVGRKMLRVLKPGGHVLLFSGTRTYHHMACGIEDAGFEVRDCIQYLYGTGFPKSKSMRDIGRPELGTALKPGVEPILMARKPLDGTVAETVLKWGTGAINVDGCRIESEGGRRREGEASQERRYTDSGVTNFAAKPGPRGGAPEGRFPANVCHDGSDEVVAGFPDAPGQQRATGPEFARNANVYGKFAGVSAHEPRGDSGSAARFFYSAKADANDRLFSKHPTVKPVALMRWLVRLVTPPGGTVLDPFAGTGTTAHAALLEGFNAILIECEAEYRADIERRMALVFAGEVEKAKHGKTEAAEDLPLFGATP